MDYSSADLYSYKYAENRHTFFFLGPIVESLESNFLVENPVLYYTILYYTILYYTIVYYTML